jgi:hypothetical protein
MISGQCKARPDGGDRLGRYRVGSIGSEGNGRKKGFETPTGATHDGRLRGDVRFDVQAERRGSSSRLAGGSDKPGLSITLNEQGTPRASRTGATGRPLIATA